MLALRTQQIIALETGVRDTPDPFGGSFYLESLTAEMEKGAAELMARIVELGGVVPALEKGFFHREIAETAYRFELDLAQGRRRIVGVNIHQSHGKPPPILKIKGSVESKQVKSLRQLRKSRDNARVTAGLSRLKDAARGTENLMPIILECVEAYATVGEMTSALKEIFGEYPVFCG